MSLIKVLSLLFLNSVFIILSGCSSTASTQVPTLYPTQYIPTVIAMTVTAQEIESPPNNPEELTTATASPTLPPSPTPSRVPPTETPNPTSDPNRSLDDLPPPDGIPQSPNQIISPGSGSKVVSPFILRAAIKPSQNSVVHIELLGEDGRLLMREIRSYQSPQTEWISLGSEVSFGVNGTEEPGRLQISVEDEHGRLESVSSVELILQSVGDQDLDLPPDLLEDIVLESPLANRLIQDGKMRVGARVFVNPRLEPFRIDAVVDHSDLLFVMKRLCKRPQSRAIGCDLGGFRPDDIAERSRGLMINFRFNRREARHIAASGRFTLALRTADFTTNSAAALFAVLGGESSRVRE